MKKVFLAMAALCMAATMSAQTLINENFDGLTNGAIPTGWSRVVNDNLTLNSQVNIFDNAAWGAYNGYMLCITWTDESSTPCDRWLITNAITIPDSGYYLQYTAFPANGRYPEAYKVKVSTTTDDLASFTAMLTNQTSVTSTINDVLNLDAFVGQTIYIAWECTSTDAYYLALDNVKVSFIKPNDIALTAIEAANYVAMGQSGSVSGTVTNIGSSPLSSFCAQYVFNGDTSSVDTITIANAIDYNETYEFTHSVPFSTTEEGSYTIELLVSNPNGEADTLVDNVLSKTVYFYNAANTTTRRVLIEEFTGASCGYCPDGYLRLEESIEGHDVSMVAHHAGFGTDGLSNANSTAMTFFYNAADGSTYAPAVMYDRTHLDEAEPGPVMSIGYAATLTQILNTAEAIPCFITLDFENVAFDESSRTVTGTVRGVVNGNVFYGKNPRLQIYLVEDSTMMTQTWYNHSPQTVRDYRHMNACHGSILGDNWGTEISVAESGAFEYNFTYTLPTSYKAWRCRLVAFVYNYNSADANDCNVYQSAQTPNFNASWVGIDEVASDVALTIYPNPATDVVTLSATDNMESVTVMNTVGQVVYNDNAIEGNSVKFNTAHFAPGMYVVTVKTANGISTKRFVVAH